MPESTRLCVFYEATCHLAAARGEGLILAVEDGYGLESSAPASDVFLHVDAVSAHHPSCTFKNLDMEAILDDLPLPTVGTMCATDETSAETVALRAGYARDRVIACARCKLAAFKSQSVKTTAETAAALRTLPGRLRQELVVCETAVLAGEAMEAPDSPSGSPSELIERFAQPTLRKQRVTGMPTALIDAVVDHDVDLIDEVVDAIVAEEAGVEEMTGRTAAREAVARAMAGEVARASALGTERFVSIVFPPPSHAIMVAANAKGAGVRIAEQARAYPAYVSVHNSKGGIERLPATAHEASPNSLIVADAATLLADLHAISARVGRNPILLTHDLDAV